VFKKCLRVILRRSDITQSLCVALVLLGWPIAPQSQTVTATLPVGTGPVAAVANPVANKIYVVNENGNTVIVIDGATNAATSVTVGTTPTAIVGLAACNNLSKGPNGATQAGQYSLTVSATAGGQTQQVPLTLIVN
jgi:YVTN family beta-propeller protein